MSLAVLKMNRAKTLKENERSELVKKRDELKTRSAKLEESINEAENEEDMAIVEEEINTHEAQVSENEAAIERLDSEIAEIEKSIAETEQKTREALRPVPEIIKNRSDIVMSEENVIYRVKNSAERRERMRKALNMEDTRAKHEGKEKSELRSFVEKVQNIRANNIVGVELLVPDILINMIEIDMQYIGGVTSLINLRVIAGTARIKMSGDAPEAIWVESTDPVPKLDDINFSMTELADYKLAGYFAAHNSELEDAFINLASHIQEQMVKGFKLAFDRAILSGKGETYKQPTGIIPAVPTENIVTSSSAYKEYLQNYKLLPDDATIEAAIMTRRTYFEYFMPQTVQVNSGGQIIVGNMKNPVMPDGTPVVFVRKDSNMLEDGQVLTGQFSKYLMAQRKGMTLAISNEVRFIEDQTVFKITGRFDGKPLKPEYFLLITLTAPKGKKGTKPPETTETTETPEE